ncbi:MAG: divalent-cation tolerance protein CutA [Anaerolineae bacterium]
MTEYLEVRTTLGSRAEADALARLLVERRLAACVQVLGPVASVYRWRGSVEAAEEWICLVKTPAKAYPSLEAAIRKHHSYETPEIVALSMAAGLGEYLAWLDAQVAPPRPSA